MNKYKKDFPIFSHKISGQEITYLDSAATSQKPQIVIDAVREFYETYNANIHRGIYVLSEKATIAVETVRKKAATFLNAKDTSEIIFTHGTTEGINILAYGLSHEINEGDAILLSEMEHHSNIVPWQRVAKLRKAKLFYIAIDESGELTNEIKDDEDHVVYENIEDIPHLKIVSITHVSNVLGTINPIEMIGKQLNWGFTTPPIFIVDAAQSAPHLKIDVEKLNCDFLVCSSHKMLGPTGVGVLYGKKDMIKKLEPFMLGSQMIKEVSKKTSFFTSSPSKFEPGTLTLEGIIGFGAALDYLKKVGVDEISEHESKLTTRALRELEKIDGITIFGPRHIERRSGIVSFTMSKVHPHDIAQILSDMGICIRAGHHCAQPLHDTLNTSATARVSLYLYNDEDDVDRLIEGLKKVKKVFN